MKNCDPTGQQEEEERRLFSHMDGQILFPTHALAAPNPNHHFQWSRKRREKSEEGSGGLAQEERERRVSHITTCLRIHDIELLLEEENFAITCKGVTHERGHISHTHIHPYDIANIMPTTRRDER